MAQILSPMEICKSNLCTGCNACGNICPKRCINLQENQFGELHPVIDNNQCIHCNQCIKVCPNNQELPYTYPIKCFASWISNNKKRKKCASGGIGTTMSEYVLFKRNGVCFGTKYDNNLNPIVTQGITSSDIEAFKGSKYVQSIISNQTFSEVKQILKSNRLVLFIGTPCQIAGLKCYLKKDYENLITVDLICHGVTPGKYLKEEISYIKSKCNIKHITDIHFRSNDENDFNLTLWNEEKCIYKKDVNHSPYFSGFLFGITLRENCFNCKYARPERISDITIGDFIGLGYNRPFTYSTKNVSSVIINTVKGEKFYNELSEETENLINIEREYKERLAYGPSLRYPFKKHKLRPLFKYIYLKTGYLTAIKITMKILSIKRILTIIPFK